MKAFYQSRHYEPLRERRVPRGPPGAGVAFSHAHPAARDALLDYFEETSIERVGVLHGEYLLHYSGMLLADRKGQLAMADMSLEDTRYAQYLANQASQPDQAAQIRAMVEDWDRLPVFKDLPVLCDPYSKNYFHFSLEMIPRLRHFADSAAAMVIMTSDSLTRTFQRDLATRTLSARQVLPLQAGLRIRDPILSHDSMSEEGVHWLRGACGVSAPPGARRLYIRRNAQGARQTPGGGLSESTGLRTLLRDFGFETIDFGGGERGVAAQVAMLDGVGTILSAHGAALTNLAYLHRDLTVIEIIGARTQSACFIHLASMLGFTYRGLFSDAYDDGLDIVVDLDELRDTLHALAPFGRVATPDRGSPAASAHTHKPLI